MCKNKKLCIAVLVGLATVGAFVVGKVVKDALDAEDNLLEDEEAWSSGFFAPGYSDTDEE